MLFVCAELPKRLDVVVVAAVLLAEPNKEPGFALGLPKRLPAELFWVFPALPKSPPDAFVFVLEAAPNSPPVLLFMLPNKPPEDVFALVLPKSPPEAVFVLVLPNRPPEAGAVVVDVLLPNELVEGAGVPVAFAVAPKSEEVAPVPVAGFVDPKRDDPVPVPAVFVLDPKENAGVGAFAAGALPVALAPKPCTCCQHLLANHWKRRRLTESRSRVRCRGFCPFESDQYQYLLRLRVTSTYRTKRPSDVRRTDARRMVDVLA